MRLHLQASAIEAELHRNVPDVIKVRAVQQWERTAAEHGIHTDTNALMVPGVMTVYLKDTTPALVMAFCQAAGIMAIDLEVRDLPIYSRSVESLSIFRLFEQKPANLKMAQAMDALRSSMCGLPLSEVQNTVESILRLAVPDYGEETIDVSGTQADRIAEDLRRQGFDVPSGRQSEVPERFDADTLAEIQADAEALQTKANEELARKRSFAPDGFDASGFGEFDY